MSDKPQRKRLSPEARRAQLLETAVDVFSEMGLERAGHADIAKRAGVSTPTVFNYFPTREALVEAVITEISGHVEAMFDHLSGEAASRRERILQLALAYRGMVEKEPGATKTFLKWSVSFDPTLRPAYLRFQTQALDRLVAILPDNPSDPAQARAEARILFGAANLYAAMFFDGSKTEAMYDFVQRIADLLGQPHG